MRRILGLLAAVCALILPDLAAAQGPPPEKRIALVIGNGGYQAGAVDTAVNDAGLIAQTLQAAGFDVVGARDLDQDTLRRAFRDFLEKAEGAGPNTVAFVYLSGYGLQLEGENYFVPVDARIARDLDVAAEAVRLSDYTRPLASLGLKASIIVLDAARPNPFVRSGSPLAGGLALVDPEPGMLIAFNAAPGTVAHVGQGPYGPYAQALAEMMREGGLPLASVFDRVRLRVNDVTRGAEVPWHASRVQASFVFFERAPDAPPLAASPEQTAAIRARPIREFGVQEAYIAALERDTLTGYEEFIAAYPDDLLARRARAIVAARREAITWRRTRVIDTPAAYWSYLRRYPNGPHAADAHRRLAFLAAALEPPPQFPVIEYDLPPPPPDEIIYVERPVLIFDDPVFAFVPPPPPPVIFLAPPPPEFVVLPPPPPPVAIFVLPIPVYTPVPVWVRPPAYVAPPPNNLIFVNVHNKVVINNTTNTVTITDRSGQTRTVAPPAPPPQSAPPRDRQPTVAPPPPATVVGPALPPSVAQKAVAIQSQPPQRPGSSPSAPNQPLPKALPPPAVKGAPPTGALQPTQPTPPTQPGQPLPKALPPAAKGPTPGADSSPTQQQLRRQQIEQRQPPQFLRQQQVQQPPQQQLRQQQVQEPPPQQQVRQQQIQQQQQQQLRQQQIQQQLRQQQIQQQQQQVRQQQIQQQQQQQQLRQQQIQQQLRQQQIQQQQQQVRQQQIQQQQQQVRQQQQQSRSLPGGQQPRDCGKPGQPACRR